MAQSMLLQDWLTLRGNGATVTQNEAGWLDVSGFQDACFYLEVGGCNNASATTVNVQTAPTKDNAFFTATAGSPGTGPIAQWSVTSSTTGVQTLKISRWATESFQPLGRYLRWSITFPGSATTLAFRIWVTLNQAGY